MLKESEIKNNSVIMIEFLNGDCKAFYVNSKRTGNVTDATMLLGYLVEELIEEAKNNGIESVWPIVDKGQTDRYYIQNDQKSGHDERVRNYRHLSGIEKMKMQVLLINNKLSAIASCLN